MHVHTYRLTPLSIWNACAAGVAAAEIAETLIQFSKYAVPARVLIEIDYASRYGRLKLLRDPRGLVLEPNSEFLAEQISRAKHVRAGYPVRAGTGKPATAGVPILLGQLSSQDSQLVRAAGTRINADNKAQLLSVLIGVPSKAFPQTAFLRRNQTHNRRLKHTAIPHSFTCGRFSNVSGAKGRWLRAGEGIQSETLCKNQSGQPEAQ